MSADLSKYTDLHIFAQAYPDRFYQMGMAEQLLMGAAAGLAREGFMPFATTYAVFASRRAYDFICMAIAEENLNVKIVCALPGLTTGYGPSHQATEDLAIMRAMPNLTVVDPCDALEIEQAVPAIADHDGPVYMRLLRGNVPLVLDRYGYRFELGKAKMLRDGADVLIVSSGFMTMRALEAAEALEADRISAGVLHVSTIKPLDAETILRECGKPGRLVVVAENHSIIGGLGEAVAALLLRNGVTPAFRQIALAGRLPRRRSAADPARTLRHFDRSRRAAHPGVDLQVVGAEKPDAPQRRQRIRPPASRNPAPHSMSAPKTLSMTGFSDLKTMPKCEVTAASTSSAGRTIHTAARKRSSPRAPASHGPTIPSTSPTAAPAAKLIWNGLRPSMKNLAP